ncbi:Fc.00g100500.m01.CDS01 [Cosmosporella sp. VM-42]
MNGHASTRHSHSHEEKMALMEEKTLSDIESESGGIDLEIRFRMGEWKFIGSPLDYLRSMPWRILLVRFAWFLVPSFLQGRHAREQIRPTKLHPTAYLDGMRGLAALFVYFCHYSYQAFTIAEGWGCGENNYAMLKLPFFRLWYQGPTAVCVFFVISGYALSYKPLKLIRGRKTEDFSVTMSSLVFRRGIRLYLPTAISTFMIVCLLRIGVYEWTREFANDRKYMKNIVEPHPKRMENAYDQWKDWAIQMFNFVHVFGWDKYGGSTRYDVHLWTIPVEFRCSLYLFLTILGTSRLQTKFRFITVAGVMWYTYRNCHWELLLFFFGMVIAELDHIRGAHVPTPALPVQEKTDSSSSKMTTIFWTSLSILGLYFMCQPDGRGEITPGWVWLTSLVPKWWKEEKFRYWQSIGGVLFVYAVGHSPSWQRFFNSFVVQYFGKLSYAIYLMHAPAMHTMGYMFEKWAYSLTGVEGYWFNAGFILGACFAVPTVIWWADVFWRAVDIPTVKFAKWIESKVVMKSD